MKKYITKIQILVSIMFISGCSTAMAPANKNLNMKNGPPIEDIVTNFDKSLSCLSGRVNPALAFSVGAILDHTGKEQFTDGGSVKFVTQGAGDIVQSALFKAGVTVINRRDPRIIETEAKWGIAQPSKQLASNYFITGSINSLDFIPGGGFEAQIGGIGPRYRQNRIMVGLDLSLTDAKTGRIVANVPIQKQIFNDEMGFGIGRFVGETLVNFDFGIKEREALHFAMRQMLNLGTFELLTQVMSPKNYVDCRQTIDAQYGRLVNTPATLNLNKYKEATLSKSSEADAQNVDQKGNENGKANSHEAAVINDKSSVNESEKFKSDIVDEELKMKIIQVQ